MDLHLEQRRLLAGQLPLTAPAATKAPALCRGFFFKSRTVARLNERRYPLLMILAMIATIALYWSGLRGPFLLDDPFNFAVIDEWRRGEATLREAILGHQSVLFARPLAMASFAANVALGGDQPFSYKLGNLLVHLLCGGLIWQTTRRLLAFDHRLKHVAAPVALVLTALWLVHPLHVSTVLYPVQRMAQLSMLFTVLALSIYLSARTQISNDRLRGGYLRLFLLFPLCVLAGLLSKQNAAVAPALCLIAELAYFSRAAIRPGIVNLFFVASLVLPACAVLSVLLLRPDTLLAGYAEYDFTLGERLLTQTRVLLDYIGQTLLPRTPLMGLYTDDFAPSRGLFSPWTTAASLAFLIAVSAFVTWKRTDAPTLFFGWWLFLLGHVVESSFLPLDLYFEHRNYLPMVGLLLAVMGVLSLLRGKLKTNVISPERLVMLLAAAALLATMFATLGRVLVWQEKTSIVAQGLRHHPDSLRARLDKASLAMLAGDWQTHDAVLGEMTQHPNPQFRLLGELYLLSVECRRAGTADPARLSRAQASAPPRLTLAEVHAFNVLMKSTMHGCGAVTDRMIADTLTRIADTANVQPASHQPQWHARFVAADIYARAHEWKRALAQAELAWQPTADPGMGALLARVQANNGLYAEAKRTLMEIAPRVKCHDTSNLRDLGKLWMAIDQQQAAQTGDAPQAIPELPCRRW